MTADLTANLTAEEAWALIYVELLSAFPLPYGVEPDAVGRALADVHPELLLAAARLVAEDPTTTQLPPPGVFRRLAAEALHGPIGSWADAFGRAVEYARWCAATPDDEHRPRPPVTDIEVDVMAAVGGKALFVDPSDTLRAHFRDAWTAKAAAVLRARCAHGALSAAPGRPALSAGPLPPGNGAGPHRPSAAELS